MALIHSSTFQRHQMGGSDFTMLFLLNSRKGGGVTLVANKVRIFLRQVAKPPYILSILSILPQLFSS